MAEANLGRIQMVHKGAYNPNVTYVQLDLTYHNDATWLCLVSSTGVTPVQGANWQFMGGGTLAASGGTVFGLGLVQAADAPAARANLGLNGHFARNAIINGNFAINQRGVSGTVTLAAGAYGHDRWKAGAAGCTYTFAESENVTTITITAGSLVQVIEGVNLFSGTYTLCWDGTAQGKIGAGSYGASPIMGAVTGGSNLNIEFGIGTVSLVQFEAGSVATPFERTSEDAQLARCQRYYERGEFFHVAYAQLGQNAGSSVRFKVNKRAIPTITQFNIASTGFHPAPGVAAITTSEFLSFRTNVSAPNGWQFHESFTADAEL